MKIHFYFWGAKLLSYCSVLWSSQWIISATSQQLLVNGQSVSSCNPSGIMLSSGADSKFEFNGGSGTNPSLPPPQANFDFWPLKNGNLGVLLLYQLLNYMCVYIYIFIMARWVIPMIAFPLVRCMFIYIFSCVHLREYALYT